MTPARPGVAQLSFWFSHADGICATAHRHPGVRLRAAWDSDHQRGARKAAQYGVDFEPDLDRLLARSDVQAVGVCAEPFRQPELVEAAAAAGKDVLVEKPMAGSLAGAERVVRAVQRHGVRLLPAFNLRWNPVSLLVKELVDNGQVGRIGRVRRLHGHYHYAEASRFRYAAGDEGEHWGADPAAEQRGSLFYVASHVTLWFRWMFGAPERVACMVNTLTDGLPVEDTSAVLLRYPPAHRPGQQSGFVGIMDSSAAALGAAPLVTEIYGTAGAVVQLRGNPPSTRVWNPAPTPLAVFDRAAGCWRYPSLPAHFGRHEYPYSPAGVFFDLLRGDEPSPMGEVEGYDSIAMLVAAEEAARSGREVAVRPWRQESAAREAGGPAPAGPGGRARAAR